MIKERIIKVKNMFFDFILFILHRTKAKYAARQSLLWGLQNRDHAPGLCPVCRKSRLDPFIDMPIGWPMPQNDHLMYYDYEKADMDYIVKNRRFIERTMGFCGSLSWRFCVECKNASLDVPFSQTHLIDYYSKYYKRLYPSSQKRKNTKERYGRYVNSLVKSGSKLLEFGTAEGYAAKYLVRQGHSVWAIEPSKFRERILTTDGICAVNNISELKENSFDCIYLHHVLEHIVDIPGFLSQAHSLLKDGGILIIQVPDLSLQLEVHFKSLRFCHFSITNRFRLNKEIIRRFFPINENSSYWMDALGNNHLYAFTPSGLEHILRAANFSIRENQQTTKDRLMFNPDIYSWPTDNENGQTPNGVTVIATK